MSSLYESEFDADSIRGVMIAVGRLVDDMVDDGRRLMVMVRELADNAVFIPARVEAGVRSSGLETTWRS